MQENLGVWVIFRWPCFLHLFPPWSIPISSDWHCVPFTKNAAISLMPLFYWLSLTRHCYWDLCTHWKAVILQKQGSEDEGRQVCVTAHIEEVCRVICHHSDYRIEGWLPFNLTPTNSVFLNHCLHTGGEIALILVSKMPPLYLMANISIVTLQKQEY